MSLRFRRLRRFRQYGDGIRQDVFFLSETRAMREKTRVEVDALRRRDQARCFLLSETQAMREKLKCVGCGNLTVDICDGDTCGNVALCSTCSQDGDTVCAECVAAMDDEDAGDDMGDDADDDMDDMDDMDDDEDGD